MYRLFFSLSLFKMFRQPWQADNAGFENAARVRESSDVKLGLHEMLNNVAPLFVRQKNADTCHSLSVRTT